MSSPIASKKKQNNFVKALISLHQSISHNHRLVILSRHIKKTILSIHPKAQKIRCLDVGCGDMQLAEKIEKLLPNSKWICIDIHELPESLSNQKRWRKYRSFDGIHIPFPDDSFDMVLFCDVLHHVQTEKQTLMSEAKRVGKQVIIKDHFEYSLWSRLVLMAMDFVGNWGYGIPLPKRYFTTETFATLHKQAGLRCNNMTIGIDLYAHIPFAQFLLKKNWHFIAVLEPLESTKNKIDHVGSVELRRGC